MPKTLLNDYELQGKILSLRKLYQARIQS